MSSYLIQNEGETRNSFCTVFVPDPFEEAAPSISFCFVFPRWDGSRGEIRLWLATDAIDAFRRQLSHGGAQVITMTVGGIIELTPQGQDKVLFSAIEDDAEGTGCRILTTRHAIDNLDGILESFQQARRACFPGKPAFGL